MKKQLHALLISCSTGNDKEDKKHDTELRNLEGELEESWDGKCNIISLLQKNKNNTCQSIKIKMLFPGFVLKITKKKLTIFTRIG